jgi:hypothetical protein
MANLINVLNNFFSSAADIKLVDDINIHILTNNISELTTSLNDSVPDDEREHLLLEKELNISEKKFLETYRKSYSAKEYEYQFGGE